LELFERTLAQFGVTVEALNGAGDAVPASDNSKRPWRPGNNR